MLYDATTHFDLTIYENDRRYMCILFPEDTFVAHNKYCFTSLCAKPPTREVFLFILGHTGYKEVMIMANCHRGRQSILLSAPPCITHWASIAGKKEAEGPLRSVFDQISTDNYFGQKSWELAERHMQKLALDTLCQKANLEKGSIGAVFSGDLLNQCISSSFPLRNTGIPHLGLYGACSTMAESLLLAAITVSGGFLDNAVAMTSSHFASSERQYRFPLGYGAQRAPTTQWTVTGSGAALVRSSGKGPRITALTIGTVTDLGIKDAGNMGAAMAPAALATIKAHFEDLKTDAGDFDLIVTGDLGQIGKEMLLTLAQRDGIPLGGKLADCGTLIFDPLRQDVHAGGSGCGCSAVVLCGELLDKLSRKKLKKILFCGTGALLSPLSTQQKMPIPGVCHAVAIEGGS